MFDFQGTLAQLESPERSVELAARQCGIELPPYRAVVLGDALGALGWPGSGLPAKVTPSFARAWADRDLSQDAHREAYVALASQTSGAFEGFAEAVYERLREPDGWVAYPDAIPALEALRRDNVPTALVSNIGFDMRPVARHLGFDHLIDHWVLSYEIRRCKPEPVIFREACIRLRVDPEEALMVGDSLDDAAAKELGCRVYLLPHTPPGEAIGLDAVRRLVCGERAA
ncbi:MAG: HAD-IA family hydrolase [Stackebrandtia sp.]